MYRALFLLLVPMLLFVSCDQGVMQSGDGTQTLLDLESPISRDRVPDDRIDLLPAQVERLSIRPTELELGLDSLLNHAAWKLQVRALDAHDQVIMVELPLGMVLQSELETDYLLSADGHPVFSGDTLYTSSAAEPVLRSGGGSVDIKVWIPGLRIQAGPGVLSLTIEPGPPAYGTIAVDPAGSPVGAGIWQLDCTVQLWDLHSAAVGADHDVWLFAEGTVASITPIVQTDDAGSAIAQLTHHCMSIGDSIVSLWAMTEGLVQDPETGQWAEGMVTIRLADPDDPATWFRVPFQQGSRDDNLTLTGQFSELVFPPECDGSAPTMVMQVQATLVDGYGCPVEGFRIGLSVDAGGSWSAETIATGVNGTAVATLFCDSSILLPTGACPPPSEDCTGYLPLELEFSAAMLDTGLASNDASVILRRPCPE